MKKVIILALVFVLFASAVFAHDYFRFSYYGSWRDDDGRVWIGFGFDSWGNYYVEYRHYDYKGYRYWHYRHYPYHRDWRFHYGW